MNMIGRLDILYAKSVNAAQTMKAIISPSVIMDSLPFYELTIGDRMPRVFLRPGRRICAGSVLVGDQPNGNHQNSDDCHEHDRSNDC